MTVALPRRVIETAVAWADRIPASAVAVLARLSIATVFWRSGRTKVDGFSITDSTYTLFAYEYRVPLIPPELAATLATVAEHLFPLLLVVGLATRVQRAGAVRHDHGHPDLRLSGRLADPSAVDHRASLSDRPGTGRAVRRPPDPATDQVDGSCLNPKPSGTGAFSTFTSVTRAEGGPFQHRATISSTFGGGPENRASTVPSLQLRTHPSTRRVVASWTTHPRNQTPWTRPLDHDAHGFSRNVRRILGVRHRFSNAVNH